MIGNPTSLQDALLTHYAAVNRQFRTRMSREWRKTPRIARQALPVIRRVAAPAAAALAHSDR